MFSGRLGTDQGYKLKDMIRHDIIQASREGRGVRRFKPPGSDSHAGFAYQNTSKIMGTRSHQQQQYQTV